jgi:two-component system, response regulator YesN
VADTVAVNLKDTFDVEAFKYIEHSFRQHFGLPLETLDLSATAKPGCCSSDCNPDFCLLVAGTKSGGGRCRQDHLRSLSMAFEIGQPYETLCHAGLFLVCIPIMEHERPLGGVFFGKCLAEPLDATALADMADRLQDVDIGRDELRRAAAMLPVMGARAIHQASQHLFILLYERTQLDPRVIHWRGLKTDQQARIGEIIPEKKGRGRGIRYPYNREQELMGKVRAGDRVGSREILNEILGAILFSNPGKLDILKARLVELLSVLSRGAVESGTDIEPLLEQNVGYITTVISLETQDDICAWISTALNDFMESIYDQQESMPRDRMTLAQNFLEGHYPERLTVRDVAEAANLSESRLSHLFRERLATTVMDYLLAVRVSRAKTLLLTTSMTCTEIAFETGFNDPSYFTRCFRRSVGSSPREFRKNQNR